jgi:imidazole glycerol-phosphate synthase subunit HisH
LIAILDYGSGNLRSAERAFATTGQEVVLTSDPAIALEADGLVVPGVGAFSSCMNGINAVNGVTIVQERLKKERPVLGICIGMQIMFSQGTENSQGEPFKGMGIWNGVVNRLNAPILPHMGWNTVDADSDSVLLKGIEEEPFYFVHSYAAKSAVGERQGWSFHGERFLAVVEDGYVCSTQFHPEKSGTAGLKLIRNWVDSL